MTVNLRQLRLANRLVHVTPVILPDLQHMLQTSRGRRRLRQLAYQRSKRLEYDRKNWAKFEKEL